MQGVTLHSDMMAGAVCSSGESLKLSSKGATAAFQSLIMTIIVRCALCSVVEAGNADPSTLAGKVMFGYQGWYHYPNDGGNVGWRHWSRIDNVCNGNSVYFELWPDMSEYSETQKTSMTYPDGQPASLFSSLRPSTVLKHFQWLQQYNLDGVFLQRLLSELKDPKLVTIRNNVTQNVMAAAQKYHRTFCVMYDISGANETTLVQDVKDDWNYLVNVLKVDKSPAYQRHNGKTVVSVWGFGFGDRPGTADQAIQIVQFLQTLNCFVIGSVPFHWRDGNMDSKPNYSAAYLQFDGLSPWSVAKYTDATSFETMFTNFTIKDKSLTFSKGKFFAPVIFPGMSNTYLIYDWAGFNVIPRLGGKFFTTQASTILDRLRREKTFVYVAMFDAVEDGTAMFPVAIRKQDTPADNKFLYLDYDGNTNLTSDHYLRLATDLSTRFKDPTPDRIVSNGRDTLNENACLRSASNVYRLCLQGDGNLVVYSQSNNSLVWALGVYWPSSTPRPFRLVIQGNTVIFDGTGKKIFAANSTPFWAGQIGKSTGPYRLIMQDDGNVVSYDKDDVVVWVNFHTNYFSCKRVQKDAKGCLDFFGD